VPVAMLAVSLEMMPEKGLAQSLGTVPVQMTDNPTEYLTGMTIFAATRELPGEMKK